MTYLFIRSVVQKDDEQRRVWFFVKSFDIFREFVGIVFNADIAQVQVMRDLCSTFHTTELRVFFFLQYDEVKNLMSPSNSVLKVMKIAQ